MSDNYLKSGMRLVNQDEHEALAERDRLIEEKRISLRIERFYHFQELLKRLKADAEKNRRKNGEW